MRVECGEKKEALTANSSFVNTQAKNLRGRTMDKFTDTHCHLLEGELCCRLFTVHDQGNKARVSECIDPMGFEYLL